MPVTMRIEGAEELAARLRRSPRVAAAAQERAMLTSLLLVEGDARRHVRHDTRRLMNSITHEMSGRGNRLVGRVGPSVRYGLYVERGSRPHWPPRAALEGWARRHNLPVFAVQRAIARRGTRARPFLVPAFLRNAERIIRHFAQAGARVTASLGDHPQGGPG